MTDLSVMHILANGVNLGALTTNSDLKNDYSSVKVKLGRDTVDTGELKVGCVIGDHCRTSIGTLINTGSVVGTGSMIVQSGRMTPPNVPSFSIYIKNELREIKDFGGFIATTSTAMSRRGVKFSPHREALLRYLHQKTASHREDEIVSWKNVQK